MGEKKHNMCLVFFFHPRQAEKQEDHLKLPCSGAEEGSLESMMQRCIYTPNTKQALKKTRSRCGAAKSKVYWPVILAGCTSIQHYPKPLLQAEPNPAQRGVSAGLRGKTCWSHPVSVCSPWFLTSSPIPRDDFGPCPFITKS